MARTNQKPPVSKRPIAAGDREKGQERQREKDGDRTWGERARRQGRREEKVRGVAGSKESRQGQGKTRATYRFGGGEGK